MGDFLDLGMMGPPPGFCMHGYYGAEHCKACPLAMALLEVEWSAFPSQYVYGDPHECPLCNATNDGERGHSKGCRLDAALTFTGLPTQELRDKAREEMRR